MKPEDINKLITDMSEMSDFEKQKLKSMGMDPSMMITSMKMMRDNPTIMKSYLNF
jgi:hypothetical protein